MATADQTTQVGNSPAEADRIASDEQDAFADITFAFADQTANDAADARTSD